MQKKGGRRKIMRDVRCLLVLSILLVALAGNSALGATYPERAVMVIVPNPPGGLNDLTGRALVEAAKPHFPQPFTIVNRPGAGGAVGFTEMLQARPDGYTTTFTSSGTSLLLPHVIKTAYKGPDDYVPVLKTNNVSLLFAVQAEKPWNVMKDFLDYAKANPGKARVGSPGIGTPHHISLEVLKEKAGANMVHVPFAGGGESSAALLGGHIEGVVIPFSPIAGHVKAGKLKVLATFEEKRNPVMPDVPTFREIGYDITLGEYQFLLAPKGTPEHVVSILNDALRKALEAESFKKFTLGVGYVIDYKGPVDLKKVMQQDYDFFGEMVRKLNIQQK
jgi:tripartite-type tricarboxylate transporter receptor subunit TctC